MVLPQHPWQQLPWQQPLMMQHMAVQQPPLLQQVMLPNGAIGYLTMQPGSQVGSLVSNDQLPLLHQQPCQGQQQEGAARGLQPPPATGVLTSLQLPRMPGLGRQQLPQQHKDATAGISSSQLEAIAEVAANSAAAAAGAAAAVAVNTAVAAMAPPQKQKGATLAVRPFPELKAFVDIKGVSSCIAISEYK